MGLAGFFEGNKLIDTSSIYAFITSLLILAVYYIQYRFYILFFYIYPSGERLEAIEIAGLNMFPGLTPYYSASIFFSFLTNPYYILYLAGFIAIIFLFNKKCTWAHFGAEHKTLRLITCLIIAILTWSYSFYEYNYFLDRAHAADRILLVLLNVIIFYRPLYLLMYVPMVFLMMSQFEFAIGGYSLTDKLMVINLVLVMNAWVIVNLISVTTGAKFEIQNFIKNKYLLITLMFVVVAASYLVPFLSKISISRVWADWWLIEDFSIAAAAYFDRGWLAMLSPGSKQVILQAIPSVNALLLFVAFAIEGLAVFLTAGRKSNMILLASFILLHIGIFSLSGIFFWKWILANLLLFVLVMRMRDFMPVQWKTAGFAAILLSPIFIQTSQLGWYIIPYQNVYYLKAETESGEIYNVAGSDMTPYDIFFTFSRWEILDEPAIYGGEWASDPEKYELLLSLNLSELREYDKLYGENRYSDEKKNQLQEFIQEYFKHYNNNPGYKQRLKYISPIKHIYMSHSGNLFNFQEKVTAVYIYHRRCYYETAVVKDCSENVIDSIEIE